VHVACCMVHTCLCVRSGKVLQPQSFVHSSKRCWVPVSELVFAYRVLVLYYVVYCYTRRQALLAPVGAGLTILLRTVSTAGQVFFSLQSMRERSILQTVRYSTTIPYLLPTCISRLPHSQTSDVVSRQLSAYKPPCHIIHRCEHPIPSHPIPRLSPPPATSHLQRVPLP
jgi:hypothetical protein